MTAEPTTKALIEMLYDRHPEIFHRPKREWVGLTDAELMECTVFKRFAYDPPYIDKNGAKHVGSMEVSLRRTYENINNKLKEKNT